ncbi:hypothetical protein Pth03_78240 [Planotetraspora thailandica]|uniref:Uncharacterized protein n=1 Tax=Planotetraspora thailandica TaxID=487172 RepID=A0A8J3Y215_9ACTN|nr:hypothetical protein [Planotetraspora thailandica]GII59435.1 hypothetical protein Pth03_78240 [Planotetraspora thailandica]
MNYQVTFHASASAQIPGLPEDAYQSLVEELLIIGADPHRRGVPDPEQPAFREQTFGEAGLVSYVIDDAAKVVRVYVIIWAG